MKNSPCDGCKRKKCTGECSCVEWRSWMAQSWAEIRAMFGVMDHVEGGGNRRGDLQDDGQQKEV